MSSPPSSPSRRCPWGHDPCLVHHDQAACEEMVTELADILGRAERGRVLHLSKVPLHTGVEEDFFDTQIKVARFSPEDLPRLRALQDRLLPFVDCWRKR